METNLQHEIADFFIDLYIEWDLLGGKFHWNAPKSHFLGYNIASLCPNEEWWSSRIHISDLERVMTGFSSAVVNNESQWFDSFRFRKSGGCYISLVVKGFFIQNEEGHNQVFRAALSQIKDEVLVVNDIEDHKDIQEHQLFASIASHELKEPIRTIDAFWKLISPEINDENGFSNYISDGISQLKALVNGLEQYSKVNLYSPQLELIDFESMVNKVKNALSGRITQSNVKLNIDEGMGEVLLDRFLMTIILQNLIINAIKYNLSEHPTITIKSRNSGNDVVFSVTDNGMGIPEKYQKLIFEPFHRIHPNRGAKGSGLGLYAARRAAEKMNGSIRCYSEVGVGSTFEVRLFERRLFE